MKWIKFNILFFVITIAISASVFAELRIDKKGHFYSYGAARNVDQKEYNYLVEEFFQFINVNPHLNDTAIVASFFVCLKMVGTPAAKRLIHDIEKLVKTYRGGLKAFYGN
ncbi:MAG: hypothetical protein P4L31_01150 [Candidatus Babeliales bacterium]|nr:hypothetical protein [Candidatus Babeliales bacterium]